MLRWLPSLRLCRLRRLRRRLRQRIPPQRRPRHTRSSAWRRPATCWTKRRTRRPSRLSRRTSVGRRSAVSLRPRRRRRRRLQPQLLASAAAACLPRPCRLRRARPVTRSWASDCRELVLLSRQRRHRRRSRARRNLGLLCRLEAPQFQRLVHRRRRRRPDQELLCRLEAFLRRGFHRQCL